MIFGQSEISKLQKSHPPQCLSISLSLYSLIPRKLSIVAWTKYLYKDTKPQMSSLLVFNRVYRLENTVSHVDIFDPSCELAPIEPTYWFTNTPTPLPCVNKYE
jgi:hypothetical protein